MPASSRRWRRPDGGAGRGRPESARSRARVAFGALLCVLLLALPARGIGPPPASGPAAVSLPAPLGPAAAAPASPAPDEPVPAGPYRWPLDGTPRVVRPFDPPPRPWQPGHWGVDLGGAPGDAVRAAGAGTVRYAGVLAGRGVVSVDHPGGLRTTYEPVEPAVHAGDRVRAGDPLGVLAAGHSGCPVPACLHWGLRRGGVYLDPLALLGLARVRLLPLTGPGPVAGARWPGQGRPTQVNSASSPGNRSASRSYSCARLYTCPEMRR